MFITKNIRKKLNHDTVSCDNKLCIEEENIRNIRRSWCVGYFLKVKKWVEDIWGGC